MAALLVGPPKIYQQPITTTTTTTATTPIATTATTTTPIATASTNTTGDSFMDLMVANFNTTAAYNPPPNFYNRAVNKFPSMGLTENLSPTFLSTGNACLDFFFHVVPDTPPESVTHRLKLAWDQDPLKALKLVCNLRGVRGIGKSDKEGFYTAALWLHEHHPKTLADNVAAFGYFKDLLEILFRLLEGDEARDLVKEKGMTTDAAAIDQLRAQLAGVLNVYDQLQAQLEVKLERHGVKAFTQSVGLRGGGGRLEENPFGLSLCPRLNHLLDPSPP